MLILYNYTVSSIEVLIAYYFYQSYFAKRKRPRAKKVAWLIACTLVFMAVSLLKVPILNSVTEIAVFPIVMDQLFEGGIPKKVVFAFFLCMLGVMAEIGCILGLSLVANSRFLEPVGFTSASMAILMIGKLVHFAFVELVCTLFPSQKESGRGKSRLLLMMVPLFSIMSLYTMIYLDVGREIHLYEHAWVLACAMGLFLSNMILFHVYDANIKSVERKRKMEAQVQKLFYEQQEANDRAVKTQLHDFKNQLMNVRLMIAEGGDGADECLSQMLDGLTKASKKLTGDCGNQLVSVILNKTQKRCEEEAIDFQASIEAEDLSFLSFLDTSAILDNILDNAVEGCRTVPPEEGRFLTFRAYENQGSLVFHVVNSKRNPVIEREGKLVSTKPDPGNHGMGMGNIQAAAKRYKGAVYYEDRGKEFAILVTLNRNKK